MGEYAVRISDNTEVKVGTCEMMYYLRNEDKDKVRLLPGQSFGDFWRLPFPDEDEVLPGAYENYNRGQRLYKVHKSNTLTGQDYIEHFEPELEPGSLQIKHECGILVNMPCYHGAKLPEPGPGQKVFWNGKSWFLELPWIKRTTKATRYVVRCRWCREMWSYSWDDIQEWIPEGELKERLRSYQ